MPNRGLFACALVAFLLGAADAGRLDATTWTLTGSERMKVSGERPDSWSLPATTLAVDAAGGAVISNVDLTLTGTCFDKPRRRFKAKPDAATKELARERLVEAVRKALDATDVRVRSSSFKMSGVVSKDGDSIAFTCRAKLSGLARVGRRWLAGSITDTLSFSGHRM